MSPEQLFPRPGGDFLAQLAGLPRHLDAAMPMRRQHRAGLPGDIRRLSHLLTDERDELRRDYLSDPAALSAYLRYFLPWNIYRLGVLFAGLALDPGGDNPGEETTVIDLGAGPLTAPLALWMARPHLRKRALRFVCVDRALKPMRLGLDVLSSLAEAHGGLAPWRVTLVKGQMGDRLREKADLVIMANALNEVLHRGENDLLEDAGDLAAHLGSLLSPSGQLLVVEPGVRPSAHLIAALRRGLLHRGLKPLAPCPHVEPCPMSGRGYTAWCHFNFDAEAAPAWLKRLSDDARLAKDNVSLSFLQVSARGRRLEAGKDKSLVRAVSGPFELPAPAGQADGPRRYGQYACSERGLTLLALPRKHLVPLPGTLIEAAWPDEPEQDAKSGALVLPLGQTPDAEPVPAPRAVKPERKPPRLPSERPQGRQQERPARRESRASRPRPQNALGQPEGQPAASPAGKPGGKPAPVHGDRTAGRVQGGQPSRGIKAAGGPPTGTSVAKGEGRATLTAGEKTAGAPGSKTIGRPSERPKGKPGGKTHSPAGKPGTGAAESPGKPAARKSALAQEKLEELLAQARALEAALDGVDDAIDDASGDSDSRPRRPAKKKPGGAAVKRTSKPAGPAGPAGKKGRKSASKPGSRAARKAKKP